MDCSPPCSSVHGISQVRILEWVPIPFSRGSSQPRDWTQISCTAGQFFTIWATREAPKVHTSPYKINNNDLLYTTANFIQYPVINHNGCRAGGRFRRDRTYKYLRLIHAVVSQKTTQHCKAIILQLKINFKKNIMGKNLQTEFCRFLNNWITLLYTWITVNQLYFNF